MKSNLRLAGTLLILSHLVFLAACCDLGGGGERTVFVEGWEKLPIKTYKPSGGFVDTMLRADEGCWLLGDTVSNYQDCGRTPHTAEIFMHNGSKALRLTSRETESGGCADNVYIGIFDASKEGPLFYNIGFSIPINSATHISFEEEGELFSPSKGRGDTCILPPCFDNISLQLRDQRGNTIVYVLQRHPDADPNESHPNYREIFLDPDAGIYDRNLFDDFSSIPTFSPTDAKIIFIDFTVDEHGWAIIDDINIG